MIAMIAMIAIGTSDRPCRLAEACKILVVLLLSSPFDICMYFGLLVLGAD